MTPLPMPPSDLALRDPVAADTLPKSLQPFSVALVALVVRLLLALRPWPWLDRLFVPDDTWYTLAIARSLAHGGPPAADGLTPTSGFQPLLAFLQVPILWLVGNDPIAPARATLLLTGAADAVAAGLLALLGIRLLGPMGALAGWLWALSPVAVANALGGLETSLALALQLAVLVQLGTPDGGQAPVRRDLLLGGLCGLALLARIDSAFVVVGVGIAVWVQRGLPAALRTAAAALVVVAPWWGWCTAVLGSPVPQSGAAVRAITQLQHTSRWLDPRAIAALATGTLLPAPVLLGNDARDAFYQQPAVGWLGIAAWLGLAGWGGWHGWRQPQLWLRVALGHALACLALYLLWVPAVWFFPRYFAPVLALQALGWAAVLARGWARPAYRRLALLGTAALLLVGGGQLALFAVAEPATSVDTRWHGAKGYAAPAQQVLAALPDGAVVGALQSGALAWFANQRVRVVNLDGVVDAEAAAAYQQRQLLQFARQRGVGYLADWPFNLDFLGEEAGRDPPHAPGLTPLLRADLQGPDDGFVLVRLDWPALPK